MTESLRGEAPQGGGFHKRRLAGAALVIVALAVLIQMVDIGIPSFSLITREKKDAFNQAPPGGELPFFRGLSDDYPVDIAEAEPEPAEAPAKVVIAASKPVQLPPPPDNTSDEAFQEDLASLQAQLDQLRADNEALRLSKAPMPTQHPPPAQTDHAPVAIAPGTPITIPVAARSRPKDATPPTEDHTVPTVFTHRSPYTLYEGTVMPITLLQGINSELPGPVSALINRDMYDTISGRHRLIPRGSRLIGTYRVAANFAASRVGVIWHRIILTDGRQVRLTESLGGDPAGFTGVPGTVNTRFWRILGAAVLSTVVRVGTRSTAGRLGSDRGTTAGQEIAVETSKSVGDVGGRLLERELRLRPIIIIPPGKRLTVTTAHDLVIDPNRFATRSR